MKKWCNFYVKLLVIYFGKKIALFFMHFLKSPLCSRKSFIFFLFIYFYSRKPPTTTSPPESIKLNFTKKKPNCCLNILLVLLHRNFNIFRWITQPPSELYIFPWKSCNLHRKVVNYQRYGRYFRPSSEYSSYNFFRRRQSQKCR